MHNGHTFLSVAFHPAHEIGCYTLLHLNLQPPSHFKITMYYIFISIF